MTSAQVQVSINAGPWISGGINAVPYGATVAFQNSTSSGIRSYVWELVDYPPGLSLPAGWINVNSVYTFYGASPPSITLPGSGTLNWGKIAVRLRVNGNPLQFDATGALQQSYLPNLTDVATILSLPSPNLGMPGFAFTESNQYDAYRSWAGAIMANLRAIDATIGSITGNVGWTFLTHSTSGTVLNNTQQNVALDTTGGSCVAVAPPTPFDGLRLTLRDPPQPGNLVTASGCNWATLAGQFQGNSGQYVENPASPGSFVAPGTPVSMPPVNGMSQDYKYMAHVSAWLLA